MTDPSWKRCRTAAGPVSGARSPYGTGDKRDNRNDDHAKERSRVSVGPARRIVNSEALLKIPGGYRRPVRVEEVSRPGSKES